MPYNCFMFCIIFLCNVAYTAPTITCSEGDAPKNTQPISDMNLVEQQNIQAQASTAFTGKYIAWSISAPVNYADNTVMIDRRKGSFYINAAVKDQFVVTITASSPCGSASTSFHVTIAPSDAY